MKLKGHPKWEGGKAVFWGLVVTGVMFAFWYSMVGNPLDEYRFMQRGVLTTGDIGECTQDYAESDSGKEGHS